MRLFLLLLGVLLPLPAQAEDWELLHFDEGNGTVYRLDRDSVIQKSDGHLYAMVEIVDLSIKDACAERDSGRCREDSDPAL